jgi:hypothetical protein
VNQGTPYTAAVTRSVDTVINSTATTEDSISYYQVSDFLFTIDANANVTTINYEGLNLWW